MAANPKESDTDPYIASNQSGTNKFFAPGTPLTDADYAALQESWISRELADQAGLRRVDTFEGRQIVGEKGTRDCAGIIFPFYWPGEAGPYAIRLRRDRPDWVVGKNGRQMAANNPG